MKTFSILNATTLGLIVFFVGCLTWGQSSGKLSEAEIKRVDEAVKAEMASQDLVGVAIGIIKNGKLAYTQGYGKSDLKNDRNVDTQTVFNYASNSKPIVAILAMQLVEQGKLDLDADIRKYLPQFPERKHPVTTRQLLCHQSGYPHYTNGKIVAISRETLSVKDQCDPEKSMLKFGKSPLIFKPGDKMSYSSYAYVILSAVIQRAGGEPIEAQLRKRIIKPLGLTSFQLDLPKKDQPHWTLAYRKSSNQFRQIRDNAHYWKHGAGGYKSNIDDFAKWAEALLNTKLLKPETQKQTWTAQKLNNGNVSGFGLGFGVSERGGNQVVSHSGSQDETKTLMVLYPKPKHGIVILCNTAHAQVRDIELAVRKALLAK